MKFLLIVLMILSLVLISARVSLKHWPSGKAQDWAYIWLQQDEYEELISIAGNSPFTRVFWCKDRPFAAVSYANNTGEDIKWQENAEFLPISNHAIKSGKSCFHGRAWKGNWIMFGSNDLQVIEEPKVNSQLVKHITRSYFVSDAPAEDMCNAEIVENIDNGECTVHLFGRWYMSENWFASELTE